MDNEKCEICDYAIHDGFDDCPNCGKNLTSFRLRYTEQEVSDMLRTLAYMSVGCPGDMSVGLCYKEDCIDCKIEYAKNNPTEEVGE